jgi:hypothetical protein
MRTKQDNLSQERLKSLLHYDPTTGQFVWTAPRRGVIVGKECGRVSTCHGYREIGVDNRQYRAHRLAFLYMLGHCPDEVDHINQDKSDNRWVNLRGATRPQNSANVAVGARRNTSGLIGVVWDKSRSKWRAQIRISGRKTNLGRFESREEAARAHDAAAVAEFGRFATLNFPEEAHGNERSAEDQDSARLRSTSKAREV